MYIFGSMSTEFHTQQISVRYLNGKRRVSVLQEYKNLVDGTLYEHEKF